MKNFVKDNWYKLMIGSSMMMASFGFMIYAVSPVYANKDQKNTEKSPKVTNSNFFWIESNEYIYYWTDESNFNDWLFGASEPFVEPKKRKLP